MFQKLGLSCPGKTAEVLSVSARLRYRRVCSIPASRAPRRQWQLSRSRQFGSERELRYRPCRTRQRSKGQREYRHAPCSGETRARVLQLFAASSVKLLVSRWKKRRSIKRCQGTLIYAG